MSPAKNTGAKNTGAKKTAEKKPEENIENEKVHDSFGAKGYDVLAQQTMDLWREQLTHFLNNPEAMKDFGTVIEPASQIFTQGLDIWLMMVDQFGKAASMNAQGGTDEKQHGTPAKDAPTKDTNGASPASALSGASTYAVAELSRRLADLEQRFQQLEGSVAATVTQKKTAATKRTPKTKSGSTSRV